MRARLAERTLRARARRARRCARIVAEELAKILAPVAKPLEIDAFPRPQVILVIGVNGSGKTTTIAKLAHLFAEQDYSVLLAAGDTFRAAAIEQLQIWAERAGVPVIAGPEGSDSSAIVFDGVKRATAEGIDVLIVDTAGRLQNKKDLMDELAKIRRVLGRLNPEAPHDVVLVLDATTGQNALSQIEVFREVAGVTGLVMTKLDGTARGGVLVAAADHYGLPIHAIGVGEGMDDLAPVRSGRGGAGDRGSGGMSAEAKPKKAPSVGARLAIDLGPLAVFFLANFFAPVPDPLKIFVATGAFMAAMIVAMLISQVKYRHISPLLWFSGLMVVVFGSLTIWLHNETFIKIKPTIYYAGIAGLLLFGMMTGRNLLKMVLGAVYPGLSVRGWHLLTRNWVIFFFAMAVLNEIIWRSTTTNMWIAFKLWFFVPAAFVFAGANLPMLVRHGLLLDEAPDEAPPAPVE